LGTLLRAKGQREHKLRPFRMRSSDGFMTTDERRLLELIATSTDGTTDALLLARGFSLDVMVGPGGAC
jgi:hypothetical protein